MKKSLLPIAMLFIAMLFIVVGCDTSATVAARNISKAAEEFLIERRIVFYNGITDTYILSVEGRCSVDFYAEKFAVTCKIADKEYVKHFLGRADNVFPFVEQLQTVDVSTYRYKVIFKPSIIIPDIDLK